jgi:hypothetical protein
VSSNGSPADTSPRANAVRAGSRTATAIPAVSDPLPSSAAGKPVGGTAHRHTVAGVSGVLPMSATPSSWAHTADTATQACGSSFGADVGVPEPVVSGTTTSASRPCALRRATRVPQGNSATVD